MTNKITAAAREFGSSRETSPEVAQAILDMAADGDDERMWAQPTPAEEVAILAAAWALAAPDETELYWGGTRRRT